MCPAKMLEAKGFPSAFEQKRDLVDGEKGRGKVRSVLFSRATGRKEGHIDEMKCRLQIADYRLHQEQLNRLEGERPCRPRPITLNDSTLLCNLRGPRGRHQNTSDEQSDNLIATVPARCDGQ